MNTVLQVLLWTLAGEGLFALLLTVGLRLVPGRSRITHAISRAPLLDIVVSLLTWVPWVAGASVAGWAGLAMAIVGQALVLTVWVLGHEASHPRACRGPRIVKVLNRVVGRAPNHLALWVSLLALPVFWMLRVSQILIYPPLRWLLGFPSYRQGEWVNVSRHKFDGLVGHDLFWCLYCDWMTGIYSLGGEMLRNVESFWCPIRFYDGKKCENCRVDFPDIDDGWVSADGTMAQVESILHDRYGSGRREWYGHPTRLTMSARSSSADHSKPGSQESSVPGESTGLSDN